MICFNICSIAFDCSGQEAGLSLLPRMKKIQLFQVFAKPDAPVKIFSLFKNPLIS